MANSNNKFDSAIRSIEENGSFQIGKTIAMRVKNRLNDLQRDMRAACTANDVNHAYSNTIHAIQEINADMASLLTALDRVDYATIQLLLDIENAMESLEPQSRG
jgi:predicted DNA-binding protein with PD1-like motif